MKFVKCLLVGVFVFGLGACSSDPDDESTGRTTRRTVATDDPATGGTGSDSGVLIVEMLPVPARATFGASIKATAQGWLDSAKTLPVTAGTSIEFVVAGGGAAPNTVAADSGGRASSDISAVSVGLVTVRAKIGSELSEPAQINFEEPLAVVSSMTAYPTANLLSVEDDTLPVGDYTTTIVITVYDELGAPIPNETVSLTSTGGSLTPNTAKTDADGEVIATFRSGIKAGDVTIKASAGGKSVETVITVLPGKATRISVADPVPSQIGIRGSGAPETSLVTVTVLDKYDNPVSDGTVVQFDLSTVVGDVSVTPVSARTRDGKTVAVITAGLLPGPVRLLATVPSVMTTPITSGKITIYGGVPSSKNFAIYRPADKLVMSGWVLGGLTADINVKVTDRYSNVVAPGTSVYVACEAGRCGANSGSALQTNADGQATFTFETAFADAVYTWAAAQTPIDFGGIVGTDHTWPALGDPLQSEVSILAMTVGENHFWDNNSNGVYDAGDVFEPTYDQGEPFMNLNSSTVVGVPSHDATFEPFWDFNVNGLRNDVTGIYQSRMWVWQEAKIRFATHPAMQFVPHQFVDMCGNGTFDVGEDIIALGGPPPTDTTSLITAISSAGFFVPAGCTPALRPNYAGFVSSGTTIVGYMNDLYQGPLPKGSKMTASVSDGIEWVTEPDATSLEFQVFGAPVLKPAWRIKDAGLGDRNAPFTFTLKMEVSDTGISYPESMFGIKF